MKNKTSKTLSEYEGLPYTIMIKKDQAGDFIARILELPGCLAHGSTEAAAVKELKSMFVLWVEDALDSGDRIPEPEMESLPSGKWLQRVPRRLHRELTELAERENVSLNQLVTAMLSEGLVAKTCAELVESRITSAFGHSDLGYIEWAHPDKQQSWNKIPIRPVSYHAMMINKIKSLTPSLEQPYEHTHSN